MLFLCILHSLNLSIIYQSGDSQELREYACVKEDSFDSKDPLEDKNDNKNFDYYAFVYQDGSSEIFCLKPKKSEGANVKSHSHSFQIDNPQNNFGSKNPMSMTFDASLGNCKYFKRNMV